MRANLKELDTTMTEARRLLEVSRLLLEQGRQTQAGLAVQPSGPGQAPATVSGPGRYERTSTCSVFARA
ncbi:MAG: hypothetical protein QOH05_1279, partial [Acetobacteraceae bacterium]|nr:hypothetical protein [Acetobacteraceae bacterium]